MIYYEASPDTYVPRVILQHLVPVKPRKRESLAPGQKEIYPFADHAADDAAGVTLHFLSKRLLSEPKVSGPHRYGGQPTPSCTKCTPTPPTTDSPSAVVGFR